jgi:hypothetical protein
VFISFFRTAHFINLLMLPMVLLVMWVFIFPKADLGNTENAFPLFLYALKSIQEYRWLTIGISLLIVVTQALYLTTVINRQSVLRDSSNLPALMYVVLMSCFPEQLSFNPLLFANFLIILFIDKIFQLYQAKTAVFQTFDAGLYIGIAALFYWPCLFLFPLIWAALVLLRPFQLKEWLTAFLGLCFPFLFSGAILFAFDMFSISTINAFVEPLYKVHFSAVFNETYIILFVFLSILILASVYTFFKEIGTFAKIKTRKFLNLFVFFFLFAALSYLVSVKKTMVSLSFLAVPLAVLFSNYFVSIKRQLIAEILFILLISAVIYNQVLYFLQYNPI